MIETSTHEHNLPNCEYIKVYYTDNYSILEKRFSEMISAMPFIRMLEKNSDFHFIKVRVVSERNFKV